MRRAGEGMRASGEVHVIEGEEKIAVPTPERMAKAGENIEDFETDSGRKTKRIQDVLDMLLSRRVIHADLYSAGRRLRKDWHMSGLSEIGAVDPEKIVVDGGGGEFMSDKKLDAARRWAKAMLSVGKHSKVLLAVVLLDEPLASYGWRIDGHKDYNRAKLAATTRLKAALEELDYRYHGVKETKETHWRATDAKPILR